MLFTFDVSDNINTRALRAKQEPAYMEEFIRQNRRFILGCASKTVHRFVTNSDDEWSVALIAFHEAVQSYDQSKGSFKSFAALVIKRRLLDHHDQLSRFRRESAADLSGGEEDDVESIPSIQREAQRAVAERSMEREALENALRDEIEAMQQILGDYGFSFFDLTDCSPKAQKTKDGCAAVIRALTADADMMRQMRKNGALPVKELCQRSGAHKKLLEHHRRYIIAAAEILDGDYPHLAEYLRYVRKGGGAV